MLQQRNTTHRHQPRNSDLFKFFRGRTPGLIAWAVAMNKPERHQNPIKNHSDRNKYPNSDIFAIAFSETSTANCDEVIPVHNLNQKTDWVLKQQIEGFRLYNCIGKIMVIAGMPPFDLMAKERADRYGNLDEPSKQAARKLLIEVWQSKWSQSTRGSWTRQLIPQISAWIGRSHGYRIMKNIDSYTLKGNIMRNSDSYVFRDSLRIDINDFLGLINVHIIFEHQEIETRPMTKAFDRVNGGILINYMSDTGIQLNLLKCLTWYLADRLKIVRIRTLSLMKLKHHKKFHTVHIWDLYPPIFMRNPKVSGYENAETIYGPQTRDNNMSLHLVKINIFQLRNKKCVLAR
nr:unnamed protein product [Callosobruchus chinensis]